MESGNGYETDNRMGKSMRVHVAKCFYSHLDASISLLSTYLGGIVTHELSALLIP